MRRGFGELRAVRPAGGGVVSLLVEGAGEGGAVGGGHLQDGFVGGGFGPVGRDGRAGAVGKMNLDADAASFEQRRNDAHGEHVQIRMANGERIDGLAFEGEVAPQRAAPQVEGLLHASEVVGPGDAPI